jgi:hypothetical protein
MTLRLIQKDLLSVGLDDTRIIIAYIGAIEPRRHFPFAKGRLRRRLERVHAERAVELGVKIFHLEKHRHAVVVKLHPC